MQLTKAQYEECQKIFIELGEEALYLNHYQLATMTNIGEAHLWKSFLTDPRTVDYVNTEMNIIRAAAINDMVHKAPNSNSVGQSQLINALQKLDENSAKKEGPAFIYTYVPLNEEQKEAPNIRKIETNDIKQIGENEFELEV